MKKIVLWTVFLSVMTALAVWSAVGTRPFRNLTTEEIESVTVELYPADVKADLDEAEIGELVSILRDAVIFYRDGTYRYQTGQTVVYTVTKTDGTQTRIMARNPALVMNGIGYQTEAEFWQALNRLGSRIAGVSLG